jgi:ribosome modulation factor
MEAKWNGLPADACPYEPGPQRTAWVVGWYISERKTPDVKS